MAAPLKPWQVGNAGARTAYSSTSSSFSGVALAAPKSEHNAGFQSLHESAGFDQSSKLSGQTTSNSHVTVNPVKATTMTISSSSDPYTSTQSHRGDGSTSVILSGRTSSSLQNNAASYGTTTANRLHSSYPYSGALYGSGAAYSNFGSYGGYYGSANSGLYNYGSRPFAASYGYDGYGGYNGGYGRIGPGHYGTGMYGMMGADDSWFGRTADSLGRFSQILDMNTCFLDQICDTGCALVQRMRSIGSNVAGWVACSQIRTFLASHHLYFSHTENEFINTNNAGTLEHTENSHAGCSRTDRASDKNRSSQLLHSHQGGFSKFDSIHDVTRPVRKFRFSTLVVIVLIVAGLWRLYTVWRRYHRARRQYQDNTWNAIYRPQGTLFPW